MFLKMAEKAAPSDDQDTTTPEANPEHTRLDSEINELEQVTARVPNQVHDWFSLRSRPRRRPASWRHKERNSKA